MESGTLANKATSLFSFLDKNGDVFGTWCPFVKILVHVTIRRTNVTNKILFNLTKLSQLPGNNRPYTPRIDMTGNPYRSKTTGKKCKDNVLSWHWNLTDATAMCSVLIIKGVLMPKPTLNDLQSPQQMALICKQWSLNRRGIVCGNLQMLEEFLLL